MKLIVLAGFLPLLAQPLIRADVGLELSVIDEALRPVPGLFISVTFQSGILADGNTDELGRFAVPRAVTPPVGQTCEVRIESPETSRVAQFTMSEEQIKLICFFPRHVALTGGDAADQQHGYFAVLQSLLSGRMDVERLADELRSINSHVRENESTPLWQEYLSVEEDDPQKRELARRLGLKHQNTIQAALDTAIGEYNTLLPTLREALADRQALIVCALQELRNARYAPEAVRQDIQSSIFYWLRDFVDPVFLASSCCDGRLE